MRVSIRKVPQFSFALGLFLLAAPSLANPARGADSGKIDFKAVCDRFDTFVISGEDANTDDTTTDSLLGSGCILTGNGSEGAFECACWEKMQKKHLVGSIDVDGLVGKGSGKANQGRLKSLCEQTLLEQCGPMLAPISFKCGNEDGVSLSRCEIEASSYDGFDAYNSFTVDCECTESYEWFMWMAASESRKFSKTDAEALCLDQVRSCARPDLPGPSNTLLGLLPKETLIDVDVSCSQVREQGPDFVDECQIWNDKDEKEASVRCTCAGINWFERNIPMHRPLDAKKINDTCYEILKECQALPLPQADEFADPEGSVSKEDGASDQLPQTPGFRGCSARPTSPGSGWLCLGLGLVVGTLRRLKARSAS